MIPSAHFFDPPAMRFTAVSAALVFAAGSAPVSAEDAPITNLQECIEAGEFDATKDYFPEKFVPDETTDYLEIEYHNSYKIVRNKFQEKSYLLYQCGSEPPADEVEGGEHHIILSVPHTGGVAVTETPQIPPPELLGRRKEIIAYIGNPKYVSSPCLDTMMDETKEVDVVFNPDDPFNSTWTASATADFVTDNPEAIIFGGPFGDKDSARVMSIAASQERTNVATFDWIGLYAALFNLEGMATRIVSDTKARYECSAANAAAMTADLQEENKPTLLWATFFTGIGWSVAECPSWDAAYNCEIAQHCGADLLERPEGVGFSQSYGGPTLYWYLTDEEFLELGKDAKYWIYPSKTFEAVFEEKKDMLSQFRSVKEGRVFDTLGQGEHSWHEQRLAEYDVVALDFCDIVGTSDPMPPFHKRRWFRNVYEEAVGYLSACDGPDEMNQPYVPAEAQCTLIGASTSTEAFSSGTTIVKSMASFLILFLGTAIILVL